jgi:DNA-binding HxlR family transcriptional regulator
MGRSLSVPVKALCQWAEENITAIDVARTHFETGDAAQYPRQILVAK